MVVASDPFLEQKTVEPQSIRIDELRAAYPKKVSHRKMWPSWRSKTSSGRTSKSIPAEPLASLPKGHLDARAHKERKSPTTEKLDVSGEVSDAATSSDSDRAVPADLVEIRKPITGVGLAFNRAVGSGCFRTACEVDFAIEPNELAAAVKERVVEAAADPHSTVRLMVQGAHYWYSTMPAEVLAEEVVKVISLREEARAPRRADEHADEVHACVCYIAPHPTEPDISCGAWLFRHDVFDGWRCVRYLMGLLIPTRGLTIDKMRERHKAKLARRSSTPAARLGRTAVAVPRALGKAGGVIALTPLALARISRLYGAGSRKLSSGPDNSADMRNFYLHGICSVDRLKAIGKERGLGGGLSNTFAYLVTAAFFAADASMTAATIANNILFDPDAPAGNHVCVKAGCVRTPAPAKGTTAMQRAEAALKATKRSLGAPSQRLADVWVALASRAYAKGSLPERWSSAIEARHRTIDLLISNLPAYDRTVPPVKDMQIARDYDNWAPSIVYACGIEGKLYVDCYFGVPKTFDTAVFESIFTELLEATGVHTTLPAAY